MKKTVVTILIVVALVLALAIAGVVGFLWYRNNHVFVEGTAYAVDLESLDLTAEDISIAYYDELQGKLPNCSITWMVPFRGGKYVNHTESLQVSALTLEDIDLLVTYFPELKQLDASECTDYEILAVAEAALPECKVIYDVDLGGLTIDHKAASLEMGFPEEYDYEVLKTNLAHLPALKSLTLQDPALTLEQIEALRTAYPDISIGYTVDVLGLECSEDTAELDLSGMTPDDATAVVGKLAMLPKLERVNLTPENGIGALSKEDVKNLMEAMPNVVFDFTFDFYGESLSTAMEEVHIKHKKIGDAGESEIRLALDLLKNCKRFVLEYCQVSYDILAKIRDDYRNQTKLVWRVEFGGGSCFTDVEVIRCTYDLLDDNCGNLIYCEEVRFMDIGHNEWLDAVPFVAGMPKLEGIIVSGAPIKDLTPFENCRNLKFLEIAFCEYINDLTPLAGCESLRMLNIGNTHALDLKPLDNLPLTHFCARVHPSGKSRVALEEQNRFIEQHPDCWTTFTGAQPYGDGWRYDEDGLTPLPYYAMLRKIFKYDDDIIPNNVGWYLSEELKATIAELDQAAAAVKPAEESQTSEETVPVETVPEETAAETVEATEPAAAEE